MLNSTSWRLLWWRLILISPSKNSIDGVDLFPYISGANTAAPHQTLFWKRAQFAAIRQGAHKLIRFPDRPAVVYNIERDTFESENLATENPQLVRQLLTSLFRWETELQSPLFLTHVGKAE